MGYAGVSNCNTVQWSYTRGAPDAVGIQDALHGHAVVLGQGLQHLGPLLGAHVRNGACPPATAPRSPSVSYSVHLRYMRALVSSFKAGTISVSRTDGCEVASDSFEADLASGTRAAVGWHVGQMAVRAIELTHNQERCRQLNSHGLKPSGLFIN